MVPVALEVLLLNTLGVELATGAGDPKSNGRRDASPDRTGHPWKGSGSTNEAGERLVEQVGAVKRRRDAPERSAHQNEPDDAIWMLVVELEGDLDAHRMRNEDGAFDPQMVADVTEIMNKVLDRKPIAVDGRPTSAVAAEMRVNDLVASREPWLEIPPSKAVATNSVDQNNRRRSGSERFEEQTCAVCRLDKALALVLHAWELTSLVRLRPSPGYR